MSDLTRMRSTLFASPLDYVGFVRHSKRGVLAPGSESPRGPCLTPLFWPSGPGVTGGYEQKLIPQDMADPVNREKLLDHARYQCAAASGTGFPGSGVSLQVEKSRLVIEA